MKLGPPVLSSIAAAALALLTMWPIGALAQGARMPCHKATEVAKHLGNKYEEAPVAFGLQSNGNLLQVYVSKKKDTWTAVTTFANGISCIVAYGRKWESLPYVSTDPKA